MSGGALGDRVSEELDGKMAEAGTFSDAVELALERRASETEKMQRGDREQRR
jgi:hypothetical protein